MPDDTPISSYSAMTTFIVNWAPFPGGSVPDIHVRSWIADVVSAPTSYNFRLDHIANLAGKVMALDGVRYLNTNTSEMTFNGFVKQIDGGNFASWGPAMSDVVNNGNPYKTSTDAQRELAYRYAYRHAERINGVFFDGHGETMNIEESQKTEMYFPSGSVILDAGDTPDPDDSNGQLID